MYVVLCVVCVKFKGEDVWQENEHTLAAANMPRRMALTEHELVRGGGGGARGRGGLTADMLR
jgi:hypothetical protein